MGKAAGIITINLQAGTAQFVQDLDKAKAKVKDFGASGGAGMREFGAHSVSSMSAASGALRELEGNFTHNIRAAERFIGTTLGLGPILQKAFPLVGALAFGGVLVELGQKAFEFFRDLQDAPAKMAAAFRELEAPLRLTNDQLRVANDRLENDIAKLQGHPQNNLKLALDEAKASADKLADSLDKDLKALGKLLEGEKIGLVQRFSGATGSGVLQDIVGGQPGHRSGLTERQEQINDIAAREIEAARKRGDKNAVEAAEVKRNRDLYNALAQAITLTGAAIADEKAKLYNPALSAAEQNLHSPFLTQAQDLRKVLRDQQAFIPLQADSEKLTGQKTGLENNKRDADLAKKRAEDQLHAWEQQLEQQKFNEGLTLNDEQVFWVQRLAVAEKGGAAYASVVETVQKKITEGMRRGAEAYRKSDAEDLKAIEDGIKVATEAAAEAGGHPAALRLQLLTDLTNSDVGLSADQQAKLASQIPDAQKAANHEATEDLRRVLREQDQEWQESGERNIHEVKARAEQTRATLEELRGFFVGIDSLIDAETGKIIAGNSRIREEAEKLATIHIESGEQGATAENAKRRLEIELQYAAQRSHSFQEELNYRKQLAAVEAADLQLKLVGAQIAHENALDEGDSVKIAKTRLDIEKAKAAIQQQGLQSTIEQASLEASHLTTLRSGFAQFFADIKAKAVEPGQILYDGLNQALDKISSNLADLFTGGKTNWAQSFQEIGKQMVESSIKSELQKGLGGLGAKLGLNLGKVDGSTEAGALWVRMAGQQPGQIIPGLIGPTFGGKPGSGAGGLDLGGLFGGGSKGGGIFSLLGKLGGGIKGLFGGGGGADVTDGLDFSGLYADGGYIPSGSYGIAGENGPEPVMGPATVVSNKNAFGGGGTHYHAYTIDARGAQLGVENRISAAIDAAHASAINTAARNSHDMGRRMPKKS